MLDVFRLGLEMCKGKTSRTCHGNTTCFASSSQFLRSFDTDSIFVRTDAMAVVPSTRRNGGASADASLMMARPPSPGHLLAYRELG
jgi:hypothetical protein